MCQAFNLTLLSPFYRKVNRLRIKGKRTQWGKKKIPGGRRIAILLLFPHFTELSLLQSSNPIFMGLAPNGLCIWLSGKESTCLPMQEMQVQSLGWEDLLEEGMAN